ncbi:hypothetical protein Q3G72_011594 [Acer saccharum]|nr:hypothetical protein Q3G72_001210 [Acer saccharum]KAK1548619.1 hypothetical protein Q3G72_011594 [Acer saccharum]
MRKPTITLAMIVKDEAHCIERCLDSVRPYVDNILIHDTGSTDGTFRLIEQYIKKHKMHGYVTSVDWDDFGTNRTFLLYDARNTADYVFMMDADEQLICSEGFKDNLIADTYQMIVKLGSIEYKRNFLFKSEKQWSFKDPIHEYPYCEGEYTSDTLTDMYILSHHDGARSKDPNKYLKDAALLESIEDRTPRQQFYLAQSYKDANEIGLACRHYRQRFKMDGYEQEKFWSAYMIGQLCNSEQWYLRAYEIDPRRAEPLLALGKLYMDKGNFACADMFLHEASNKRIPEDALFIETDVYEWRAMLEYAVFEPIPEVPIRYRLFEETDLAFVIDSWIRSYRKRLVNQGIDRACYFYGQLALIKYLAQTTKVLIACDAKQPMYIVGWGCAKVSDKGEFQLHYVYVKEDYRQHGVARAIVTHLGYRQGIGPANEIAADNILKVDDEGDDYLFVHASGVAVKVAKAQVTAYGVYDADDVPNMPQEEAYKDGNDADSDSDQDDSNDTPSMSSEIDAAETAETPDPSSDTTSGEDETGDAGDTDNTSDSATETETDSPATDAPVASDADNSGGESDSLSSNVFDGLFAQTPDESPVKKTKGKKTKK